MIITPVLLGLNLLVFACMTGLERVNPDAYVRVLHALWLNPGDLQPWGFITSCFVHGGWLHIGFNMLFLWVFGPPMEDRLGRIGFSTYYLLGGVAACALHVAFDRSPVVGASGAIAAVTGGFVILFPGTQIRCLWLLGLSQSWVSAPWFVGFAVVLDFILTQFGGHTGIAHLAHLGGYAFGAGVSFGLLATGILPREEYDVFAMLRQAHRRRVIREAVSEREREVARRLDPREGPNAEADRALAEARAEVSRRAAARDWDAATGAYADLLERFSRAPRAQTTLTRDAQLEIGNRLFTASRDQLAAEAYERFVGAFAADPEAPRVMLMLALVCVRRLGDRPRGRRALEQIGSRLSDPDERALADALRAEAAEHVSAPPAA